MKSKSINSFDTPPNSCFTKEDKMSLDNPGRLNGMGALEKNSLIEILVPLLTHPYLISYLDEQIADELCDRGYFDLVESSVTALGRDLLATNLQRPNF